MVEAISAVTANGSINPVVEAISAVTGRVGLPIDFLPELAIFATGGDRHIIGGGGGDSGRGKIFGLLTRLILEFTIKSLNADKIDGEIDPVFCVGTDIL